eukprot:scaffold122475_cov22-Tisochrysis_lutea.AAC.2
MRPAGFHVVDLQLTVRSMPCLACFSSWPLKQPKCDSRQPLCACICRDVHSGCASSFASAQEIPAEEDPRYNRVGVGQICGEANAFLDEWITKEGDR